MLRQRILSEVDVQEQVDEILTRYAVRRTREAVQRAEAIIEGQKGLCRCPNCVKRIAFEANSWIAFVERSLADPDTERRYEPEFERGRWSLARKVYRREEQLQAEAE